MPPITELVAVIYRKVFAGLGCKNARDHVFSSACKGSTRTIHLPTPNFRRMARRNSSVSLFGGVCFLVEWLLSSRFPAMSPTSVVVPIIGASLLAGVVATFLTRQTSGVRDGIRAGVVSALIGSSLLIVLSILRGERSSELLGVELLALLSFPPAVSLGLIGAIIVTFARNPPALSPRSQITGQPSSKRRNTLLRVVLGISVLCYLAPLLFLSRAQTAAVGESEAPIGVTATDASPVPTPIPWHYEKPANFSSLPGAKIGLLTQKEIAGIDQNLPMAIAPDGRQFAFFTNDNGQATLEIFDLDAFQPVATFPVSHAFSELAWAPNSKRIFYVPPKEENFVGVVDIDEHRVIALPIPKNKHVPDTLPYWWKNSEVIFPGTGDILDLEALQLLPLDRFSSWNALSQADRDRWLKDAPSSWVTPPDWKFEILKQVTKYDFDSAGAGEWTTRYDIAVADKGSAFSRVVAEVDLRPGDRLLNAPDGSKVILVRENVARVFYLSTADSLTTFSVALPEKDAAESARVFVCPAIVNPLNGKVVGANRDRVKAIARVIGWKDGKATCWIEQEYVPVEIGDIAGDVHEWMDDSLKLTSTSWGKIEAAVPSAAIPSRSKVESLGDVSTAAFDTPHGVATVTDIHAALSKVSAPPATPADGTVLSDSTRPIRDFIENHHRKSSANDIEGLAADYADQVEYFNDGIVDREFIRKDSASYHAGYTVTESVPGGMFVGHLGDQRASVKYQLMFMRRSVTGKWMRGIASVELEIQETPAGYQITKQHAKILNKEQSP